MHKPIRRVGVIGAGVMGSGIAAHLANAGVQAVLLDIVPPNLTDAEKGDKNARNRFAAGGLEKALKARPAAFFTPAAARLVDQQRMADAAAVLARARDTVVIIDTVTPIPLLAAQHAIVAADAASDRYQKLAALAIARASLERALGYADAATRKALQGEISNLETQVRGGSDIRTAIANLRQSLADAIRRFTGTKRGGRPSS